jgi:hypothetical protein
VGEVGTVRLPPDQIGVRSLQPYETEEELAREIVRLRQALEIIAAEVHLVLSDYYSGCKEEHEAAMPAYGRLTMIFEYEDDQHELHVRDAEGIVAAALTPPGKRK